MPSSHSPDEILAAANEPGSVLFDCRTPEEVKESKLESRPFINISCTLEDCSELIKKADQLFPDKTKPVIIYCRSGRRAGKAKEVLEQQLEYTNVMNAGGLVDLTYL